MLQMHAQTAVPIDQKVMTVPWDLDIEKVTSVSVENPVCINPAVDLLSACP